MNMFALLQRGIQQSGVRALHEANFRRKAQRSEDRRGKPLRDAVATTRRHWTNALVVDETRAWMELGSDAKEVLTGLVLVLTLAAFCKEFDDSSDHAPEIRIIRGAISAARQCADQHSSVMNSDIANAFKSAANAAKEIIAACSGNAIVYAAQLMRDVTGAKQ